MLVTSIILLAVSAVAGLLIFRSFMTKKETSKPAVFAHGLFAASGLLVLVYFAIQNPDGYPQVALALLVLAALGGFYLAYKDLIKKTPGPSSVMALHAILAVAGFLALIYFAWA